MWLQMSWPLSVQSHEACSGPAAAEPLEVFLLAPRASSGCVPGVPLNPLVGSLSCRKHQLHFVLFFKASRQGLDDRACQVWWSC